MNSQNQKKQLVSTHTGVACRRFLPQPRVGPQRAGLTGSQRQTVRVSTVRIPRLQSNTVITLQHYVLIYNNIHELLNEQWTLVLKQLLELFICLSTENEVLEYFKSSNRLLRCEDLFFFSFSGL